MNERCFMPEPKTIKCPFCKEGDIQTLYTPKTMVTKYARAASNKKAMNYYKDEKYSLMSDKCPSCHKTKKEIEKYLKYGKPQSKEDIIKRAQESGLPLRF